MKGGAGVKVSCKVACRCAATVSRLKQLEQIALNEIYKLDAWKLNHALATGTEIASRHDYDYDTLL